MSEYCAEIRRCFRAGIETDTYEGEVLDDADDLDNIQLRKEKRVKVPEKLTPEHREFLRDALNF